jgi:hypothetical protein
VAVKIYLRNAGFVEEAGELTGYFLLQFKIGEKRPVRVIQKHGDALAAGVSGGSRAKSAALAVKKFIRRLAGYLAEADDLIAKTRRVQGARLEVLEEKSTAIIKKTEFLSP